MKIMVIGVGRLGSQVAFVTMLKFNPDELILSDIKDLRGDILDLQHAAKGMGITTLITDKKSPADFIILALGASRSPTSLNEKDLLPLNKPLLEKVDIKECLKPDTTIVVMTNPVHEMTEFARTLWPGRNVVNPEKYLSDIRGGKDYGTEIIKTKGYTNFGAAVSAALLIEELMSKGHKIKAGIL